MGFKDKQRLGLIVWREFAQQQNKADFFSFTMTNGWILFFSPKKIFCNVQQLI